MGLLSSSQTFYVLRSFGAASLALATWSCSLPRQHAAAPEAAPSRTMETRSIAVAAPTPTDPSDTTTAAAPLTLDEVIALAFAQNPDIRAAAERIAEAEARVGEATAAFYPQLSTRLAYTRTDNPAVAFGIILAQRRFSFTGVNFNEPGPTQDVRPEIIGAIPLFRGGQDYERREAATLGVEAAKLERAAMRNVLADAVIAAYYALLAGPEEVEVTRLSIDAVGSALAQARARVAAGTALKSDPLSLEVRQAAAQEGYLRAHNGVELARSGLRILLGMPATAPLQVIALKDTGEPPLPDTFPEALQQAVARRPEIQAAARVVAMREHEVKAERAAYLPRIDAVGSYGQDAENLELSQTQDNWTFGATAELDLFSGFRTQARVRAAEQRLAEARQAERKARLEVERDVQTAFLTFQEARQRARVSEAAITAAEEALRLVQEQYQAGAATITRYLEAEVARTDARSRAIAARYDTRRAEAGLRKAVGQWAEVTPQ
jgi:outer membrane protein